MTTNLYNYNSENYADRYTRDKQWIKLLFNHGRVLQTAELIEMQSIMQDFIKQGMDTLFTNGSVLSGLKAEILSISEEVTVTISSGKFYIDGIIIDISSSSLNIPLSGEYNIGLLITPRVITEEESPILRDPIKGGAEYGLPGAARLIWESTFVLNNPASFTIAKLINGGLIQKESNIYSKLNSSLADFTYARTGNFCVKGLEPSSIEGESRSINNIAKYSTLEESLAQSSQESQLAYSQVLLAKQNYDSLNAQYKEANDAYQITPTNSNLLILQDLKIRVNEANDKYNEVSRVYISKKLISDKAEINFNNAKSLLVDKVYISISPGIAYVEGYRVNLNSPSILEIPKSLDISRVDNAIFTYAGSQASSRRTFFLATNALWSDVVSQNTLLTLNISKLLYNQQFIDLSLSLNLNSNSFNSVSSLLDYLTSEINKSFNNALSELNISSTTLITTPETLRSILKSNLIIEKEGTSLLFTSTTLNNEANQIEVDIKLSRRNSSNIVISDSEVILTDVNVANLSGAGKSNSFQLGFRPVVDVISLTAELQENLKPIVRGIIPGTSDNLGDDSIFNITKVIQGDTVYVEGRDYSLINQSQISWLNNTIESIEPQAGTTYYVSFLYTQPLSIDKDFILNRELDSIEFTNTVPAPNQKFYVDYSYYLAKAGVITLNKDGILSYSLSSSSSNPIPPSSSSTLLTLATFKLFANKVEISPTDCKLLSFPELQSLVQQVKRNTLELEKLTLDSEMIVKANNESVTPLAFYNTGIVDLTKLNVEHPLFNGAISPSIQAVTGGYTHKDIKLKYVSGGSIAVDELNKNSYVGLPYTSNILISQERITKTQVLKPISSDIKKRAKLFVSPQISFLNKDVENFTSCDVLSQQTSVLTRLSENKPLILQNISINNQNLFRSFGEKIYNSFIEANPLGNHIQDLTSFLGYIGNKIKVSPYPINIKVENLPNSSEGYRMYLGGKEIKNYILKNNTPLSVKYPGTIKAKQDGTISLEFYTPEDLFCGTHSLEIISDGEHGYAKSQIGIYNNLFSQIVLSALDSWDISFNKPTITDIILNTAPSSFDTPYLQSSNSLVNPGTIPSVSLSPRNIDQKFPLLFDSINQTFRVYDYYFLTQFKIKLKSVSLSEPLIANLGYATTSNSPDRSYISSAFCNSYNVSELGENWSTFTFTYPVLLDPNKKYSISLTTKGTDYEVFTAEIGTRDLITGGFVGDQLYLEGEVYLSRDGKGLDKVEKEDLSFQLLKAQFDINTPVIIDLGRYGNVDNVNGLSSFCLNTRDITPPYTSIQYQYKPFGESNWINFEANTLICLSQVYNYIDIRANLISTVNNLSPYLFLAGSSVSLYLGLESSSIISQQTTHNTSYKNISIILKYMQPTGTTLTVYYSPNNGSLIDGQEWFELTKDISTEKFIDQGLDIKEATWKLANSSNFTSTGEARTKFRFRIDFSTTNKAIQPSVKDIITYVY